MAHTTLMLQADGLAALCDLRALRAALRDRGVATTEQYDDIADIECALLTDPGAPGMSDLIARAHDAGTGVLILGRSWIDGSLRLSELGPDGRDHRTARLNRQWQGTMHATTVAAALSGLAADGSVRGGRAVEIDSALDPGLSRELTEAMEQAGIAVSRGAQVFVTAGNALALWPALLGGRNVVVCGPGGPDLPALIHRGETAAEAAAAALSALADPRPVRDMARRVVAVEVTHNALSPAATDLADAIAEAAEAVRRPAHPRISVVISSYNYARFLGTAIESARQQSYPAHEIIVVDDGSTDETAEVLARHRGIETLTKRNGGQASAINAGYAKSTGDIVLFLDADDVLSPEALESIARAPFHRIARLSFGLDMIDGAGGARGLYPATKVAAQGHLLGALLTDGIFEFMPMSGNAFPRRVLDRILPLPEADWRISADLLLIAAAAAEGPSLHEDRVLGSYRAHGQNNYFKSLSGAPFLHETRMAQRSRAWREVGNRLSAQGKAPTVRRRGRLLQWSACREALPAGVTDLIALGIATLTDAGRPRSRPVSRARLPGEVRAPRPSAAAARLLREPDRLVAGGRSTWPLTTTGSVFDLGANSPDRGLLGRGWPRKADPAGALASASAVSLCLALDGPPRDWRIEIAFTLPEGVSGDLTVWVNGLRLQREATDPSGSIVILVPRDVLDHDPEIGAYPALIVLDIDPDLAGAIRFTRLAASALPPFGVGVPAVGGTGRLALSPGSPGIQALRDGWDWPTDDGVRMAGDAAGLAFAVPFRGPGHVWLRGRGPAPRILMDGAQVAATPLADGQGIGFALSGKETGASGTAMLTLLKTSANPGEAFVLEEIRASARAADDGALLAGERRHGDVLLAAAHGPVRGLEARDGGAAIVGPLVCLPLRMAASDTPGLAMVEIGFPEGEHPPAFAEVGFEDLRARVVLAGPACLRLPVSAGPAREVRLTLHIPDRPEGLTLRSVALGARIDRARPPEGNSGPEQSWNSTLDADALMARAADPADWHPPQEGALWLASPAANLLLPPPPPDSVALRIETLTLPDPLQRMTFEIGTASVESVGGGRSTLLLPLPPDCFAGPLTLRVTADTLVAPAALGIEGDGLLAGALLGIDVARSEAGAR